MKKIAEYQLDEELSPKRVSFCAAQSLTELPALIKPRNSHFVLFLALDASKLDPVGIYATAEQLLDLGMVWACVWGADCEKVHDIIDQAKWKKNPNESDDNVVMTTWHDKEPLSEAVWFFLNCAFAVPAYEKTCDDWIAAVIGNPKWEKKVRSKLATERRKALKEQRGRK